MGTTPLFSLPYIEPGDSVNAYPAADKAQADKLDATLAGRPHCEALANAVQAMATSAEVAMVFHSVGGQSPAGMFTAGGTLITVPADGLYQIVLGYSWAGNATGSRIALVKINGATNRQWSVAGAGTTGSLTGTITLVKSLASGTTIGLTQFQASGGSLNTITGSYPSLTVTRLGPL